MQRPDSYDPWVWGATKNLSSRQLCEAFHAYLDLEYRSKSLPEMQQVRHSFSWSFSLRLFSIRPVSSTLFTIGRRSSHSHHVGLIDATLLDEDGRVNNIILHFGGVMGTANSRDSFFRDHPTGADRDAALKSHAKKTAAQSLVRPFCLHHAARSDSVLRHCFEFLFGRVQMHADIRPSSLAQNRQLAERQ